MHEIKHDGIRIVACLDVVGVRLFTRKGTGFTAFFPQIAVVVAALLVRSCLIDGEACTSGRTHIGVREKTRRCQLSRARPKRIGAELSQCLRSSQYLAGAWAEICGKLDSAAVTAATKASTNQLYEEHAKKALRV